MTSRLSIWGIFVDLHVVDNGGVDIFGHFCLILILVDSGFVDKD